MRACKRLLQHDGPRGHDECDHVRCGALLPETWRRHKRRQFPPFPPGPQAAYKYSIMRFRQMSQREAICLPPNASGRRMAAEEGVVSACHTKEEFHSQMDKTKEAKKLVVIDFTASWCDASRFMAPVFPHVVFLKVDIDELRDVAEEYNVQGMPTFHFVKGGEKIDIVVGAKKDELRPRSRSMVANPPRRMASEEGVVITCHTKEEFDSQMDKAKEAKKLLRCFAKKYLHVAFLKVDVDELRGMPTFHFIKDGEKIDLVVGANKDELLTKVEKHAGQPAPSVPTST
ncbi:hypothetical protein HU200_016031 [Digitaria exilis]|uniref:Thioredoxin domain-containing protein n=1 Tax=Digitaria exilis TaxID=1010633 RepID=A0A835F9U1_9POAL|nr:hypothetical protein HU200_016031 [Digitaria exilis]